MGSRDGQTCLSRADQPSRSAALDSTSCSRSAAAVSTTGPQGRRKSAKLMGALLVQMT